MSRHLWIAKPMSPGGLVSYEGKTYKVVSQPKDMQDSCYFKRRYYTLVTLVV